MLVYLPLLIVLIPDAIKIIKQLIYVVDDWDTATGAAKKEAVTSMMETLLQTSDKYIKLPSAAKKGVIVVVGQVIEMIYRPGKNLGIYGKKTTVQWTDEKAKKEMPMPMESTKTEGG